MAYPDYGTAKTDPGQNLGAGARDALHIEKYNGSVLMYLAEDSKLLKYVNMDTAKGTSIVTRKSMGEPILEAIVAGQVPDPKPIKFSKVTVEVDTVMTAKQMVFVLDYVQSDIPGLLTPKSAKNQAMKVKEFIDENICSISANGLFATYNQVDGFGGPLTQSITAANLISPDKLFDALDALHVKFKEANSYHEGQVLVLAPDIYNTLLKSGYISDRDFTNMAGDTVTMKFAHAFGWRVVEYNNMKNVCTRGGAGYTSALSNADNGNRYDITSDSEADNVVALVIGDEALFGATSIDMVSDVFYDEQYESHFVKTKFAMGFNVWRPAHLGGVYING